MKKLFGGIIIGTMVTVSSIGVFASVKSYTLSKAETKISVDGTPYNATDLPILNLDLNGGSNTYVPLRAISEMLDTSVSWNGATNSIEITSKNTSTQNSKDVTITNEEETVDGKYEAKSSYADYVLTISGNKLNNVDIKTRDGNSYNFEVSDGNFNGKGVITYKNQDTYTGDIQNGYKSGTGIYTWSNGSKYEGQWKDDKMNGTGIYYYPSGSKGYKIEGTFVNNLPTGECLFYVDSSTSYSTTWQNGRCIKVTE